ncbi:hypothetical protein MferCBS31731_001853 [Microsporum ferrugineum]
MSSRYRLTVASIWKLETDGIDEVTKFFKSIPHGSDGFCKYESVDDVFSIDNCSPSLSASAVAEFLVEFIDREKEHDLLEKPKITRLSVPSSPEVEGGDADSVDDQLIEQVPNPEAVKLPVVVKYWQGDDDAIECFVKAPRSILTAVTQATGAQVDIEASNKRIRVTSMELWQADNAMERLSNLQMCLSLMVSPQVANILHIGGATDFRLRIIPYKSLNDIAMRRILVDGPESKLINHLHDMFVTVMEVVDQESQELKVSKNVAAPPRLAEQRKGRARVWDNFEFQQIGDASLLPNLPPVSKEDTALKSATSIKDDSAQEEVIDNHPWLSQEKAFFVNRWVKEGVQAGAVGTNGSEPNSTLPPEPSAEVTGVPKLPAVLKRRQPLPPGNIQGAPKVQQPVIENTACKRTPKPIEQPVTPPSPPASVMPSSFNAAAYGHPKKSPPRRPANRAPIMYQRPRGYGRKLPTLIDTSITGTESVVSPMQQISFTQTLVPSQLTLQPRSTLSTVDCSVSTTPTANEASFTQERLNDENRDPTGNVETNEERLRKLKLSTKESSTLFEHHGLKIIDGEEATRVFHRTMGQGTSATSSAANYETKAEQKARKQAALLDAWGPTPAVPPCKPAQAPEPSQWKKAQLAKENAIDAKSIKDLFGCLKPVLDAVQYFTGTLTVEVQLGLILTNSVPKLHAQRTLDLKVWNPLFRPRHGLPGLTTVFNHFLTTSGADVDYFFQLSDENSPDTLYFEPEPENRRVFYEFHCQTKDNDNIVIVVNEDGAVGVNRPDVVLGATNIHFPLNIWDLRATIKGSQEYSAAPESEILKTVKCMVDNLYIPPNRSRVIIFTRVPEDSALRITKILMRRTTRHKYVGKYILDRSESNCEQPVFLQVTEMQRLISGNTPADKNAIRVRSISSEEMVDDSRLWFEASIVSPAIDEVLKANKNLTVGERVDSWCPDDLLGIESHLGGNIAETGRSDEFLTAAERAVGSAGIGSLFRVARKVVEKIDAIGWANHTPATFIQDKYPSPLTSAGTGPIAAPQTEGGKDKVVEAKSVAPTQGAKCPYW